jgi:putative ABC transport system substrate-binding protein
MGVLCSSALSADVAVMVSSDIIPYNTCLEGIKEKLTDYYLSTVTLGEDVDKGRELLQDISRKKPKAVIAIGPQAAFVLSQEQVTGYRFFCMILNPQRLLNKGALFPGVSLNIPPEFQMQTIRLAFSDRKRIGAFFSRELNQATVDALAAAARKLDLIFVPLPIASAQEIPALFAAKESELDVLLIIPDDQLGSTKIVEYLIKETLRKRIPVVGYNSWFAKNGAVLSYIVDYKGIGMQTGRIVQRMLAGEPAGTDVIVPPEKITISLDMKTAEKIQVKLSPAIIKQADEVLR